MRGGRQAVRHIEASKKIVTLGPTDPSAVKYSFVQRMRNAFNVETVGEGVESFSMTASSKMSTYGFSLNVSLKTEPSRVRLLIDGQNELKMATKIFYVVSLFLVLILSLMPEGGGAAHLNNVVMNAIFFLVVGSFTIYDYGQKMDEPEEIIDSILTSIEAEFG
jgi:hypothetical protein